MEFLDFYRGKRVFITGHTGFKGSWLSRILANQGAIVTGYAALPTEEVNLFDLSGAGSNIRSVIGDIRDFPSLKAAFDAASPEIVFHLAAQPIVRQSYKDPVETFEVNVMGTVNILECIRLSASVRSFVNVTTDKVYENREWLWGYRENENLCGLDPYSNSKSCSELVTYSYRNSFFRAEGAPAISTARSGNVIGGGDFAADRIIPDCVRAALAGRPIIVRNPHSTRPYQHVLECLSGYLLLAFRQYSHQELSGNYNFGPDEQSCITTDRLVQLFCDKWGRGQRWENQSDGGPHEAGLLRLDCTKAKQMLDWHPFWPIDMAIQKTIEFVDGSTQGVPAGIIMDRQISEYFSPRSRAGFQEDLQ